MSNITIIWVDKNIENSENSSYKEDISKSFTNLHCFTNIEEGFNYLKDIKFSLTYFIISGSLFIDFCTLLKLRQDSLLTVPRIIIFTPYSTKMKIENNEYINESFYNKGGVTTSFSNVKQFLNEKIFDIDPSLIKHKIYPEEVDFTFKPILNKSDLIVPVFLSELLNQPDSSKYKDFDEYLMNSYGEKMCKLISQVYKINCPNSIRVKYWLRAYTLETAFYDTINTELMQGKIENYINYISLLYHGIENNYIKFNLTDNLYRGAVMNTSEINNIKEHQKKSNNYDSGYPLPFGLLYCKSFMSFSLDKDIALGFMRKKSPKSYQTRVLYILLNSNNIYEKFATNADLTKISYFTHEKEILLFPFSFYEINRIEEKDNYYEIYLNYLGKYKKLYNIIDKSQVLNVIPETDFVKELESLGLLKPIWKTKKSVCRTFIDDSMHASGLLCNINFSNGKSIRVLITISYLFRGEYLNDKNNYVKIENEHSIYKIVFGNRKIYNSQDYRITIIEIKPNKLEGKTFLELDERIFLLKDLNKNFRDVSAYIMNYEKDNKEFSYSFSHIKSIDKNGEIIHDIGSVIGDAGSPILSLSNFKVIGIHIGRSKTFEKNLKFGRLLSFPINEFKKLY